MRVRSSMGMLRRGGDARDVIENIDWGVGEGIKMRIGGVPRGAFLAGSSGCQFSGVFRHSGESNAHLIRPLIIKSSSKQQAGGQTDRQAGEQTSKSVKLDENDDN